MTRWTSIGPDNRAISVAVEPVKSCLRLVWLETPTTTIDALTPRANSMTASGTSSPTTVWNDPVSSSTSSREACSWLASAPVSPSERTTWTATSSLPAEREAMRAARRITASLSEPPVMATTTRSRAGQGWSMRCSRR